MQNQLRAWQSTMAPLFDAGVGVYPVRGNHEADVPGSTTAWSAAFTGRYALPANGPTGETGLTYSFTAKNALFVGLDEYVNLHRVNQAWLDAQLAANTSPHVFVFGHERAARPTPKPRSDGSTSAPCCSSSRPELARARARVTLAARTPRQVGRALAG